MNVIVTGCAGFIGWKVCEFLLHDGHTVLGLDNLNDAYDVRLKEWRLAQLEGKRGFNYHPVNVCDREAVHKLFHSHFAIRHLSLDAIINLAARAGVRQSVENPWVYYDTNVTGCLNLLELCREFGVKKFVLASTSSLYGAPGVVNHESSTRYDALQPVSMHHDPLPSVSTSYDPTTQRLNRAFKESDPTDHPLSPYAASKKAAEALCFTYHYLSGIDVTVSRYFTVYGPVGRPDMSLFRFVQRISEGLPITVYGDGTQSRDFTYVDDIARGTVMALKPLGYEIINLGSDQPIVLKDAIQLIERLVDGSARIEYKARHPADVMATWADIRKAKSLLSWEPSTSFEDGVARLVEWYQRNRDWARDVRTE